ncbi:MAG: glycosyltransferase family 2 protein, partial [Planctomycetia bacterium]
MRAHDVSVVVITFNAAEVLLRTMAAVASQSAPPRRVLIIDNKSGDGARERIRESVDLSFKDGRCEVHELPQNLGFATANNRAIAMCDTEFVALLNPDAFPHPDWLEKLLAAAERHPE